MKAKNCVTHYYACDCREELFNKIEAENASLKTAVELWRDKYDDEINELEKQTALIEELAEALYEVKANCTLAPKYLKCINQALAKAKPVRVIRKGDRKTSIPREEITKATKPEENKSE